ncbi:MAG: DUF1667 domain-containing protein [Alphaproteobacteria bacterium]|nr:DUF1667 domain-containing protein [Alphaproteobacteria bacterium]
MSERLITCTVCPNGCQITVKTDDKNQVTEITGFKCKRGEVYAKAEVVDPVRTLTALVQVQNGEYEMCPVRTNIPVSKAKLIEIADLAVKQKFTAPIEIGQVLIKNVLDTGADIVATKSVLVK